MRNLFLAVVTFFLYNIHCFSQTERTEYLTVRVQYGKTMSGYKYEVYCDIGVSGSHSLSGQVINQDDIVTITDDHGKYEFKSDMDLINYLAKNGWIVIHSGEIQILDQHYYTYLMERKFVK